MCFTKCISAPALSGSSALQCVKLDDGLEIHEGASGTASIMSSATHFTNYQDGGNEVEVQNYSIFTA